ncbi:MAG: hypothetical protein VZR53_14860 [Prevotella sp.]|nr:hypothetical protein [Prevotella sp.]
MSKKRNLSECLASDYLKAMEDGNEEAMRELEHMMDKDNGFENTEEDNKDDEEDLWGDDFEDEWD